MEETAISPCQSKVQYNYSGVINALDALKKKGQKVTYYKCDLCDGYHITSVMDYNKPELSEEVLMSRCFVWANNTFPELRLWGVVHIPNGGTRSRFDKYKSKALGIRKGFPDLQVILPSGKIFFIEMKVTNNGVQSKEQKECQKWMEKRKLEYYLINSEDAFRSLINEKMGVTQLNLSK